MNIMSRFGITYFIALIFVLSFGFFMTFSANAEEELQPSGKITIDEKQINIGIGASWGQGVLTYKGVDYKFKVKGFKAGAVGIAKVSAVGHVYNMDDLSKFNGTYTAASAAIALGGGVGGQTLGNQNDVYMRLGSTQKGVNINIGLDGITVELQE